MTAQTITRANLDELVRRILASDTRVVAPVAREGRSSFAPVNTVDDITMPAVNTTLPPKDVLFPRTEPVVDFTWDTEGFHVHDVHPEASDTVLFGLRPCDAAGFDRLAVVFNENPCDRFFAERRAHTLILTFACREAGPACFCTAVGLGPASSEGSDLLLVPIDDESYAAEAVTEKAQRLLGEHQDLVDPPAELANDRTALPEVAQPTRTRNLADNETRFLEAFDDERWHAETLPCLGCGICAYTCPSCHCFDLIEEGGPSCGTRLKVWDCCAFSNFTVHASGHNPRSEQASRYRQRLLHKLAYFPQKWGSPMCVGCGRCVEHCPVGMDIYEVAHAVLEHAGETGGEA